MGSILALVHRIFISLAFGLCTVNAAVAQIVRFEGLSDPGYAWSRSWVDIDNDGRDDYCVLADWNAARVDCYISDGTTFSTKRSFNTVSGKDPYGFRFADMNGDGQVDLCRAYGQVPYGATQQYYGSVRCQLGPDFSKAVSVDVPLYSSYRPGGGDPTHWQFSGSQSWETLYLADVNVDGLSDICYVHSYGAATGPRDLRCLIATGSDTGPAFQAPTAAWTRTGINQGWREWPRGFYDFNGDGYPDFCRLSTDSGQVVCTIGGPSGFAATEIVSTGLSNPYHEGAAFIDANGDGNTDFCRLVGNSTSVYVSCKLSNGVGWHATELTSHSLDAGDGKARWWADINADGFPDFCRAVSSTMLCRLGRGDGTSGHGAGFAAADIKVANVRFGADEGGRGFCDAAGTGIPTFCTATYTESPGPDQCYVGESGTHCWPTVAGTYGISAGLTDEPLQARHPLLVAFSDGAGAETRITYLPASSKSVYTRDAVVPNPRALIVQPRSPLVYETRAWRVEPNGTQYPLTGHARYFYKNMRNDTWAASLGFRERWIFTEGTNTLDHVVHYQGLGPSVDPTSVLNDSREIGLVKYQERFAVSNGHLPSSATVGGKRTSILSAIKAAAATVGAIQSGPPSSTSPFVLLQRTSNTLGDTEPVNPRYRFISKSVIESWDWNSATQGVVALPKVETSTTMSKLGNVQSVVQTTTAGSSVWRKTTSNTYQDNESTWILGRLTKSTVTSEAPSADVQIAAHPRKAGNSPTASTVSSSLPSAPQPLSPATLAAILQLLLED